MYNSRPSYVLTSCARLAKGTDDFTRMNVAERIVR